MRCYICQKLEYPFQEVFQKTHTTSYTICETCFIKHPAFIRIETMPNMYDLIHIIQIIHDGTYPSDAYGYMFDVLIQKLTHQKQPFILVFENMEEKLLARLQLFPFGTLWIINTHIQ